MNAMLRTITGATLFGILIASATAQEKVDADKLPHPTRFVE